jgi:predicted DNA-binding transcriptional regulator YafY
MSEFVRLGEYQRLLSGRAAVPRDELLRRLEISPATFKRDIAKLRDQVGMPIKFDRDRGGYTLDATQNDKAAVPSLWFAPDEILALLTMQHLLSQLEPGLLGPRLKPLKDRLNELLALYGQGKQDIANRLRIVHAGKRALPPPLFEAAAGATMARKRLRITHMRRETGETLVREVSPQRMVHYRDNWYMDAWCHLRDDLRSFSLDAISQVEHLETDAKDVPPTEIDARLGAGYGIFGGKPKAWATLRFTPERARWVRFEQWHPMQEGSVEADGSYVLCVPYSDDREIVGDIMKFGADVQVIAPSVLRSKVQQQLLHAATKYVNGS